jgi:hypothetical protein
MKFGSKQPMIRPVDSVDTSSDTHRKRFSQVRSESHKIPGCSCERKLEEQKTKPVFAKKFSQKMLSRRNKRMQSTSSKSAAITMQSERERKKKKKKKKKKKTTTTTKQ